MQIQEMQKAIREEGLDGWLFFDHHLRDPLAYRVLKFATAATPTRRWYYLVPAEGEPRGLVHRIESGMLNALPGKKEVYSGWSTQVEGLAKLLAGCRTVAMQYSEKCAVPYVSMVDGGTLELIRDAGVKIATSANLIQLFEARWTDQQLAMHLEAGKRVDEVRAQAFATVAGAHRARRPIGEFEVKTFIREAFERARLVTDHGPIVSVNDNMSDPHYEPDAATSRPIRPGDAMLIDMWAKLDQPEAVFYDITWTGFCGADAPARLQHVFEVVRDARESAARLVIEATAAGRVLHGYEVDDAARGHIQKQGFGEYFIHRTGHSIGEEVHGTGANMDNLETHDERRVIPRTCFSIEPGVYLPEFGIRSEVNIYVDQAKALVTGEAQQELVKVI